MEELRERREKMIEIRLTIFRIILNKLEEDKYDLIRDITSLEADTFRREGVIRNQYLRLVQTEERIYHMLNIDLKHFVEDI